MHRCNDERGELHGDEKLRFHGDMMKGLLANNVGAGAPRPEPAVWEGREDVTNLITFPFFKSNGNYSSGCGRRG